MTTPFNNFGTIAFSWKDGKEIRRAAVNIAPSLGIDPDEAIEIFTAGLAAIGSPVYTVESTEVSEQVSRAKRARTNPIAPPKP